ncbi:IclR family transcriptional regulator [Streptomyces formicae]|uniref:IclR family transcriptional regulator n=1 Tax=Streptomyces formicae TaxID=1616117 RepID=A0ABY3WZ53_9ACTN|nr:IclR family transcriptional regulator [Streptomyces formicae]
MESVDNALRLLLLLQQDEPLRVSDAAEELGVARSTAHRLLAMLRYRGFAEQGHDKIYRPGPAFYRAGLGSRAPREVSEVARPYLEALNQQVGETVHLVARAGADVRFLDSVETTRALRVGSRAGALMPAHRTSGGKALLAELSYEELAALYADGLPTDLPFDVADVAGFHRALAMVRRAGYGLNSGESEPGVTAVGACVHGPDGRALAALAVSAPSLRLPKSRVPEIAAAVRATASRLSAELAE